MMSIVSEKPATEPVARRRQVTEKAWSGIYDLALTRTDRKEFVCNEHKDLVVGRSIPSVETLRRILGTLVLPANAKVLHVGAGVGYIPAVLSQLAQHVVAVEKSPALIKIAEAHLARLKRCNVQLRLGEGAEGAADAAPFDIILVTTPQVHNITRLLKQLSPRGQLLCLEESENSQLMLVKYKRLSNGKFSRCEHGLINFVDNQDEILIELGLINSEILGEARRLAKVNKTLVIDEVRRLKSMDDSALYHALSQQYGLPLGSVEQLLKRVDPKIFGSFSKAFLDHERMIPLYIEDNVLKVATYNPDASMAEMQKVYPQLKIDTILVTPTDYRRLWSSIDLCLQSCNSLADIALDRYHQEHNEDLLEKDKTEVDAYLVSVFEALLLDAVAQRASDIHIEQYAERVRIRLRIDGELVDSWHYDLGPRDLRGLINVIKLRGELNIAERRLPQGGRARLRMGNERYDLRIQIQPALHGEHVVIRLLPQNTELISIEKLGLPHLVAESYKRLLRHPAGLVLVVGPTGSGKSTTLYAGLQLLAADATRKVITVEDPIEYSIDNIQQTRVRPEIGFSFADAMRSFVRQDPDVILVGEIRDHETALEAVRASQTGHVVLSTLHCNDAIDAMQRLFDLNIHANSLASELLAVMAQRLAKKICPHCREQTSPDPEILHELFPAGAPDSFRCYMGRGCEQCSGNGTRGRIAVVEYLRVNADIRNAISRQIPVGELRKLALDCGLVTMRDSALDHVIQGNIPLTELPRILPADRMAPEARWQWERTG